MNCISTQYFVLFISEAIILQFFWLEMPLSSHVFILLIDVWGRRSANVNTTAITQSLCRIIRYIFFIFSDLDFYCAFISEYGTTIIINASIIIIIHIYIALYHALLKVLLHKNEWNTIVSMLVTQDVCVKMRYCGGKS